VQRAKALLLAADGGASTRIAEQVGVSPATVAAWRERFAEEGVSKLGKVRSGRGATSAPHADHRTSPGRDSAHAYPNNGNQSTVILATDDSIATRRRAACCSARTRSMSSRSGTLATLEVTSQDLSSIRVFWNHSRKGRPRDKFIALTYVLRRFSVRPLQVTL
jgi:hypothetical protein